MRKAFLTALNIAVLININFACKNQQNQDHVQDRSKYPYLYIYENVFDFGKAKSDSISYAFTITNSGNAPLVIHNIETSCGCITTEYTKMPILPQKNGSIKVTIHSGKRIGTFQKDLRINSNAKNKIEVISIRGNF